MSDQPNPSGTRQALKITAIGIAVAGVFAGQGRAQDSNGDDDSDSGKPTTPAGPTTSLPPLVVTGTATAVSHEIPQSIVAVGQDEIAEQGTTSLEDALRNVPGITLNSGEGGAHGDSINLRGISVPDSFFLDGLRDIGTYQRDTFDEQTVELPLGPSSVLFGRGSTAGVINQVTKQPLLAPLEEASVVIGTAGMERGTADLNWVMGDHAAARLDLMGQSSGVADRDYVRTTRNGIAPAVAFGIDQPTSLTVSFLHQDENDIPDYGIPFVDGTPANVDRGNYYGLLNYDRTETEADIATARFEHKFNDHFSLTHSLRYGHYEFAYLLSAPHLDDDYTQPPAPGSPLADILVYRDQPSSAGTEEEFVDRTDLTSKFEVAGIRHSLITGVELSSERSDISRYENGIDTIPPTPLLDPDPNYSPPTPLIPDALPRISGSDVSAYAMDRMRLGAHWDLDGGFRWDSFDSHFSDALSGTAFSRNDTEVSPRAAVVFNPSAGQSIYLSYGESYNPAIEYLTLAPTSSSLSPEKDYTTELGAKVDVLHGSVALTGALFDTLLENARLADPDDPTIQQVPFDQRVLGVELGATGYVTSDIEIIAGYTHLDDRIAASTDPLAVGRLAPNSPPDSASLWAVWEPGSTWKIGGGPVYMSHRFADTDNYAGVPSYVVLNGMVAYRVNRHLDVQLNVDNLTDKLYFSGIYYSAVDENHAVPGPGRTVLMTATVRY
jgi:catecholate siderophore receptor